MNYSEVYMWLKKGDVQYFSLPIKYGVLYRINGRAFVESLRLLPAYRRKSAFPRLFGDDILVTQSFRADDKPTVYCVWLETNPEVICMWQRIPTTGISQVADDCFRSFESDIQA